MFCSRPAPPRRRLAAGSRVTTLVLRFHSTSGDAVVSFLLSSSSLLWQDYVAGPNLQKQQNGFRSDIGPDGVGVSRADGVPLKIINFGLCPRAITLRLLETVESHCESICDWLLSDLRSSGRRMGRGNISRRIGQASRGYSQRDGAPAPDLSRAGKRERPTRHQPPPPTLPSVDVHGIIFAVVALVFVVYPLAQLAFSLGEQ